MSTVAASRALAFIGDTLNPGCAALPDVGASTQCHDVIVARLDVLELETKVVPHVEGICQRASYLVEPAIASALEEVSRQQQLGVRVEALEQGVDVPAQERPRDIGERVRDSARGTSAA